MTSININQHNSRYIGN